MPDRWGRITADDWNAATGLINNINAVTQRSEDHREQKEYRDDVNANLTLLREGDGNYGPSGPTGTERSHVEATSLYAKNLQNQQLIKGSQDTQEYEKSLGGLVAWRQENPDTDWEKAPKGLYAGVNGQKAYVEAIRLGAETAEGKQRRQAAINKAASESYPVFVAQKDLVQKTLQSGDINTTVNLLQKMSEQLPIPYKLGEFNQEDQSFDVQYLDSNTGKFQSTGKQSLQQVVKMMNAIGEKQYVNNIALTAMAVDQGNREKRHNPLFGRNTNGDRFLVIPQKQWANPNQVDIEVRNEKTNEKIMFPSWEAMQDFGIQVENLDREKSLKDLEVKDQQIATSKAKMRSHDRANKAGGKWAARTMYKDGKEFKPRNLLEERKYLNAGWSLEKPAGPGDYAKTKDRMAYEQKAVTDYQNANPMAEDTELDSVKAVAGTEWQARVDGWKKVSNPETGERGYQTPNGVVDIYGQPIAKKSQKDEKGRAVTKKRPERTSRYPEKTKTQKEADQLRSSSKPSLTKNAKFQSYMEDLLKESGAISSPEIRQAIEITKGEYNQNDKTITFRPKDRNALRETLLAMGKAGITYDAKEGENGEIIVSVIESQPKMELLEKR